MFAGVIGSNVGSSWHATSIQDNLMFVIVHDQRDTSLVAPWTLSATNCCLTELMANCSKLSAHGTQNFAVPSMPQVKVNIISIILFLVLHYYNYVIWALFAQTFEWYILCGRFVKCSHYPPIVVIFIVIMCSWTRWELRCKDQMKKTHQRSCEYVIRYLIYSVNLELFWFVCVYNVCPRCSTLATEFDPFSGNRFHDVLGDVNRRSTFTSSFILQWKWHIIWLWFLSK